MPQQDDGGPEMQKALKILSMVFVTNHQPAEIEEPGEESFDLPAPHISAQQPSILGLDAAVCSIWVIISVPNWCLICSSTRSLS